jgi:hypothetical protein
MAFLRTIIICGRALAGGGGNPPGDSSKFFDSGLMRLFLAFSRYQRDGTKSLLAWEELANRLIAANQ